MTKAFAFGAALPTGSGSGEIDLGIALRDQYFCRERVAGPVRDGLKRRLAQAIEQSEPGLAAVLLSAFLDSFAVAGMVDSARTVWTTGPDAAALAVLARAGQIICLGEGLKAHPGGPWPVPTEEWIRQEVGDADQIVQTHEDDGARWIADRLALELVVEESEVMPEVIRVSGDSVAEQRIEIVSALVREEAMAVLVETAVPNDSASQLAMGEIRLEARAQKAFEAYGWAGLWVQDYLKFDDLLGSAPEGHSGEVVRPRCSAAVLPGTPSQLRQGRLGDTGWLLWEGPVRPVAVQPVAVELMRAMDGKKDHQGLAAATGLEPRMVRDICDALRQLGAVSAV